MHLPLKYMYVGGMGGRFAAYNLQDGYLMFIQSHLHQYSQLAVPFVQRDQVFVVTKFIMLDCMSILKLPYNGYLLIG